MQRGWHQWSISQQRWGDGGPSEGDLRSPTERFNDFLEVLHIKYFYNGEYPREGLEEEFHKWFRRVEDYISSLESKVKSR